MSPLVSIIIPVYNPGNLLAATLRSALNQSWENLEILVVDDGSTDGSGNLARTFACNRLRVISQDNAGSCAARNTGVRHARGDYVQFLDHDDLLSPDKISIQLNHPTAGHSPRTLLMGEITRFHDAPHGERREIVADADYHPAFRATYPAFASLPAREWLRRWWTQRLETTPLAWLIPRPLLEAAGPWDERFLSRLDDFEFITRLLLVADQVVPTPGAHAWFRTFVAGSMSSAQANRSRRAFEGQHFALNLCCDHLLASELAPDDRAAAASLLMDYAYASFPRHPDLAASAEHRARLLDAPRPPCPGGRFVQTCAPFLGWRLTKRLQHLALKCGYFRP